MLAVFGGGGAAPVPRSPEEALRQVNSLQSALASILWPRARSEESAWLEHASRALESAGVHEAAREVGMSYESFRKKFARLSGTSPARFRQAQLIDRACDLIHRGRSNKQISAQLGFCDEFHFSRTFKKVTGATPRDFARRLPRA
jgi:AraC-like DNA-binding protein